MPRKSKELPTDEVEDVFEPDLETPIDAPVESFEKSTTATVKLLTDDLYDGCYLVYDVYDRSRVYLVPKEHLQYSYSAQEVLYAVLDTCAQPYDWEAEIRAILPAISEIRLAILRNGLLTKDDLLNKNLARNALYGAFPNRLPIL